MLRTWVKRPFWTRSFSSASICACRPHSYVKFTTERWCAPAPAGTVLSPWCRTAIIIKKEQMSAGKRGTGRGSANRSRKLQSTCWLPAVPVLEVPTLLLMLRPNIDYPPSPPTATLVVPLLPLHRRYAYQTRPRRWSCSCARPHQLRRVIEARSQSPVHPEGRTTSKTT